MFGIPKMRDPRVCSGATNRDEGQMIRDVQDGAAESCGAQAEDKVVSESQEKRKKMLELCLGQPAVKELIPSLRNRLEILNGPGLPRI